MQQVDNQYGDQYFNRQIEGASRSAMLVAPLICSLVPEATNVVDVGCGTGAWLKEFKALGLSVQGLDGNPADASLKIDPSEFQRTDLSQPIRSDRQFDVALCLEVAEHLPKERAAGLVADLCRLSDVVFFGAAIPRQRGTGHINEQWQSYWVNLFQANGFTCSDPLRPLIWDDRRIEVWYRQNILCFRRKEFDGSSSAILLDVVHPDLWNNVRKAPPKPYWRRALGRIKRLLA